MSPLPDIVLFDAIETIGSEVARSREERFVDFRVYPSVRNVLRSLAERARLGVFSLAPDVSADRLAQLLAAGGVSPPIDPELIIVASPDGDDPFEELLARREDLGERIVFVSLDASRRMNALASGLKVSPHPALVGSVLGGQPLTFVRLAAPEDFDWRPQLAQLPAVSLFRANEPESVRYMIAAQPALDVLGQLENDGLVAVEHLADSQLVERSSLVLLRLSPEEVQRDSTLAEFIQDLEGRGIPVLRETPNGHIVALPGDRSPEEIHPPPAGAAHGHALILLPSAFDGDDEQTFHDFGEPGSVDVDEEVLASINADSFRERHAWWSESISKRDTEPSE